MKSLETIKAEERKRWDNEVATGRIFDEAGNDISDAFNAYLDTAIDRVAEATKEAIVPEPISEWVTLEEELPPSDIFAEMMKDKAVYKNGYNTARLLAVCNYQSFIKGENDNTL